MAELSAQATSLYLELRKGELVRQVVIVSHVLNPVSGSTGPEYALRFATREVSAANSRKQWQIMENPVVHDSLYATAVQPDKSAAFGLSLTQLLSHAPEGLEFLKARFTAFKQEYTMSAPVLVVEVSPAEVLAFSRGSWPETYGSRINRARDANDFGPLYV